MTALDQVLDADLKFLKDSGRNHRVRAASQVELEEQARAGERVFTPATRPEEMGRPRVYVAVRQIEPGVLRRLFVVAADGMPTDDLSEDQAQALFEHLYECAGMRPRPILH
jgi:hypothetical protein